MRIEYIFIRKNNEPVQVSEKIYTLTPPFKPFLKSLFEDVSEDSFKIKLKTREYDVFYNYTTSKSESSEIQNSIYYLTISIDGQRKERCAEILDLANKTILSAGAKEQYNIILAYDGVSKYYCDRTYPRLNEFERSIRNLVFRILTKAFGAKWLDKTATDEEKNNLKAKIQIRPKLLRDERLIEEALYEMDIKELENYLFVPKRDVSCEQVVDTILSEEKLAQMTKEEIESELAAARPKSLWERQFAHKVSIDGLHDKLKELRILRNKVAHAKAFSGEDFSNCQGIVKDMNAQIEQAILDVSEKEYDLSETIRTISDFGDAWTSTISKAFEHNMGISSALSELGSSIKNAYQALNAMPSLEVSGALKHLADLTPIISAVQNSPMMEIQKRWDAIKPIMPSPAVMQAANQAAQTMQLMRPQMEAIQRIYRLNNFLAAFEPPIFPTNSLTSISEDEEREDDYEENEKPESKDDDGSDSKTE